MTSEITVTEAQTIVGLWHGEIVRLTLTPEFVQQAVDDMRTLTHLMRLREALAKAEAELALYGSGEDWAGLNVPARQFTAATKALKEFRKVVRTRCEQLAMGIEMREHLLGK